VKTRDVVCLKSANGPGDPTLGEEIRHLVVQPFPATRMLAPLKSIANRAVFLTIISLFFQFSPLGMVGGVGGELENGPLIIAAMGTSLTHRGGWLAPLQEYLSRCLNRQVSVLDFARSGETSAWGLSVVQEVIGSHPHVVLIEFSANDAAWFKGFSLEHSRANTGEIVRAILGALPETKIFLMTMSPGTGLRRLIRPNLDAYYGIYEDLAGALGVGYIDNRPAWRALNQGELRRGIPDGRHPLPELASRLIVPTIAKAIAPECNSASAATH